MDSYSVLIHDDTTGSVIILSHVDGSGLFYLCKAGGMLCLNLLGFAMCQCVSGVNMLVSCMIACYSHASFEIVNRFTEVTKL